MLHDDEGEPHRVNFADQLDSLVGLGGVQAGHDLVQQHDRWLRGDGARQFDAFLVCKGQAAGDLVALVLQPGDFQDLLGPSRGLARGGMAAERPHHDVLQHGHLVKALHDLERPADAQVADPVGREACDVLAVEKNIAAGGIQKTGHTVEEGGLAGAVRSDQP